MSRLKLFQLGIALPLLLALFSKTETHRPAHKNASSATPPLASVTAE